MDGSVERDPINDGGLDVVDLQGGPRGSGKGHDLGLVDDDPDAGVGEHGRELFLDVEARGVVHQQGFDLVTDPRLLLVVLVPVVSMVRVPVSVGTDLVDRLGKDDVLVENVVPEQLPHDVFTERREEEELELLGKLAKGFRGGQEGGDGGVSTEDGAVLLLGLFGGEFPSDGALLSNLDRQQGVIVSILRHSSHGAWRGRIPRLTFWMAVVKVSNSRTRKAESRALGGGNKG